MQLTRKGRAQTNGFVDQVFAVCGGWVAR